MSAEAQIDPASAQALLDKDTLNRTNKVIKGGTLTVFDRRKLQKIVKRAGQRKPAPKEKKIQTHTRGATAEFEGTFEQKRRRRKVFELRLRRYSIREMADELEVDKTVIVRDLKAIDAALTAQIDPIHATKIINETLADYETVKLIALEALPDAEGNERAALLNCITKASEAKTALLQDAGTLPKAGRKMELTGKDGVPLPVGSVIIAPVIKVVMEETQETRQIAAKFHARAS